MSCFKSFWRMWMVQDVLCSFNRRSLDATVWTSYMFHQLNIDYRQLSHSWCSLLLLYMFWFLCVARASIHGESDEHGQYIEKFFTLGASCWNYPPVIKYGTGKYTIYKGFSYEHLHSSGIFQPCLMKPEGKLSLAPFQSTAQPIQPGQRDVWHGELRSKDHAVACQRT